MKFNLEKLALILLIAGGLNWGLLALFNLDLVAKLGATLDMVVKVLVGAAAVYTLIPLFKK
jgi:uncharacterized protein